MQVSYIEFGADDAAKCGEFLESLLGWQFTPMGDTGDGWFDAGAIRAGLHGGERPPSVVVYFGVADLGSVLVRVRELGGTADEPGPEEPGFGRFANCTTPDGLRFGLHQR